MVNEVYEALELICTILCYFVQVEQELKAQVQLFCELTGQLPHHMDGHQHVHVLPGTESQANLVRPFGTTLYK